MKRTIYVELLETIKTYRELAVTGNSNLSEKDIVHACYTEFDCGYLTSWQLRDLLRRI